MRFINRKNNEIRKISIEPNINPYAEGSCIIRIGNTHIICTASIEPILPSFLKGKKQGWLTAEYGMLPRSTHTRMRREATVGKLSGRTQEIQRLIGRSLRSVIDLKKLGERQITIDCDVIQADGGTRTASITGGYVALCIAINNLLDNKVIDINPIINQVAAVSCGILNNEILLDLDYNEDSQAEVDANFVMTKEGQLIEIQSTAEKNPFSSAQFNEMLSLANSGTKSLIALQAKAINALTVSSL